MKRSQWGKKATAPRGPREIRVRMTAPRPVAAGAAQVPDVWVVNGRVIRFLDPSRPDVDSLPQRSTRRFGLFRTLAHR